MIIRSSDNTANFQNVCQGSHPRPRRTSFFEQIQTAGKAAHHSAVTSVHEWIRNFFRVSYNGSYIRWHCSQATCGSDPWLCVLTWWRFCVHKKQHGDQEDYNSQSLHLDGVFFWLRKNCKKNCSAWVVFVLTRFTWGPLPMSFIDVGRTDHKKDKNTSDLRFWHLLPAHVWCSAPALTQMKHFVFVNWLLFAATYSRTVIANPFGHFRTK